MKINIWLSILFLSSFSSSFFFILFLFIFFFFLAFKRILVHSGYVYKVLQLLYNDKHEPVLWPHSHDKALVIADRIWLHSFLVLANNRYYMQQYSFLKYFLLLFLVFFLKEVNKDFLKTEFVLERRLITRSNVSHTNISGIFS